MVYASGCSAQGLGCRRCCSKIQDPGSADRNSAACDPHNLRRRQTSGFSGRLVCGHVQGQYHQRGRETLKV